MGVNAITTSAFTNKMFYGIFFITTTKTSHKVQGKYTKQIWNLKPPFHGILILSSAFKKFSDKIFYCCVSLMHAESSAPLNGSNIKTYINYTMVATDITLARNINIYLFVTYCICVNHNKHSLLILYRHSVDVVTGCSLTLEGNNCDTQQLLINVFMSPV